MSLIVLSEFPIYFALEHNDVPVGTIDLGDWGIFDVFEINHYYVEERAGLSWVVTVTHPSTGNPVTDNISPFETFDRNLPPPARFESQPLRTSITLVRA